MKRRWAKLRRALDELFPERHLYVRSGGEMKAYVLSPQKQMIGAAVMIGAAMWMGVSTAAVLVDMSSASATAKSQTWIAGRQAQLNTAVAQLNVSSGPAAALAEAAERRHAALLMLLTQMQNAPGAARALAPAANQALMMSGADPERRLELVRESQERLLAATDNFAKARADRMRQAFRLTGLTPSAYGAKGAEPRALPAHLQVEPDFAARVQHASANLSEAQSLAEAAKRLPLAAPTNRPERSSSYGVRVDPFTRHPAFHSGLDFPGGRMTPIRATGPGVVSFTGVRAGYGNTVEVDHGRGLKTRYGHLASIAVKVGQQVVVGQQIGGMGSTGRSTGTHLHYEVWLNGRPTNPDRFLKAGAYVRQAG